MLLVPYAFDPRRYKGDQLFVTEDQVSTTAPHFFRKSSEVYSQNCQCNQTFDSVSRFSCKCRFQNCKTAFEKAATELWKKPQTRWVKLCRVIEATTRKVSVDKIEKLLLRDGPRSDNQDYIHANYPTLSHQIMAFILHDPAQAVQWENQVFAVYMRTNGWLSTRKLDLQPS